MVTSQLRTIFVLFLALRLALLLLSTPQGVLNAYTDYHFYFNAARLTELGGLGGGAPLGRSAGGVPAAHGRPVRVAERARLPPPARRRPARTLLFAGLTAAAAARLGIRVWPARRA